MCVSFVPDYGYAIGLQAASCPFNTRNGPDVRSVSFPKKKKCDANVH
jgi:hypothetical protein